jgi:ADP-ribose pyrophosphatase YjhB (NUDIX family)
MQKLFDLYKFCPSCKAELDTKNLMKACRECKKEYFFNPKPTSTCILKNEKGEYLLVKRSFEPFKDWWDIPGGFVDDNESLEQATIREVKEETGLDIKQLKYLGSRSNDYEHKGIVRSVVGAVFFAEFDSADPIIAGDDAYEFELFTAQEVPIEEIAFDVQREFFRNYLLNNP